MYDFSREILSFHRDQVALSRQDLNKIRQRRNINRKRIISGLSYHNYPLPYAFYSQGSYAMNTMVQDDEWDYDIDDGIYFDIERLIGPRGGQISALEAKRIVCFAIHSDNFNQPPEYLKNCVRVYYREGYRVDVPVYRRTITTDYMGKEQERFELASTDWKLSDARNVTKWFEAQNGKKSPTEKNGRQMRRICRLVKKFARSRNSWKTKTVSGFAVTNLVAECYYPFSERDDIAFYQTMANIYKRLQSSQIIMHPIIRNEVITKSYNDPKVKFFRNKIRDALIRLNKLFLLDCTEKQAMKILSLVFNSNYFEC